MFRHAKLLVAAAGLMIANLAPHARAMQAADAPDAVAATEPAATAPAEGAATEAPAPTAMKVVVQEVKGLVQVRTADGQPWQPAKVGMEVNEGAEFRTGPRSSVTCVIPPDQTIVLDRLGTVKVAEAVRSGDKIKTDLVMKYGRSSYAIEAAGAQHESTIRSPSSTLAVRGTRVSLYDQPPFVPEARSFTGRATYQNAKRQLRLGGPGRGARIRADRADAADSALGETVVDPSIGPARTSSESELIENEVSRGALLNFDQRLGIQTVRGGAGPQTDAELQNSLPGRLNFVLRWTGNADLNLIVDEQRVLPEQQLDALLTFLPEEILFPGFGLNVNQTGGVIPFNHRGGPNGGQEIAFWSGGFPEGIYGLAVQHASGEEATFRFNAFLDGQPQNIFAFDADGNLVKGTTITRTLAPAGTEVGIVLIPPNDFLNELIPDDQTQTGSAPPPTTAELKAAAARDRKAQARAEKESRRQAERAAHNARLASKAERLAAERSRKAETAALKNAARQNGGDANFNEVIARTLSSSR
jgi:hypothetical protein